MMDSLFTGAVMMAWDFFARQSSAATLRHFMEASAAALEPWARFSGRDPMGSKIFTWLESEKVRPV
jgi:hypothetical protein